MQDSKGGFKEKGKKIKDLPGGQIIDPLSGKTIFCSSSHQLPFLSLGPLNGLFELTQCPSRPLDLTGALLPELQRYKDTVKCGALGVEVPGHRLKRLNP